jgi:hypothetical protein
VEYRFNNNFTCEQMSQKMIYKLQTMKKLIFIQFLSIVMMNLAFGQKSSTENGLYKISVSTDFEKKPRFLVTHKTKGISREIIPQLHLVYSLENPKLMASSAESFPGVIGWKQADGKVDNSIFNRNGQDVIATNVTFKDNRLIFRFKQTELGEPTLIVELPQGKEAPSFIMGIKTAKAGWYSLGFTGLEQTLPEKLDFLYQPLTWSWKRFPAQSCITEEAYATTAATFINKSGYTEGIAPSPEMIPYRYALSAHWNKAGDENDKMWKSFPINGPKGNSLFGLLLRSKEGFAQPTLFAPLLGGEKSFMKAGELYSFTCKYIFVPGDWMVGSDFIFRNIFKYKNERQNADCSLNQTFDNILNFAMNDAYGGWDKDLKASNYRFDVPGSVKNVSALHPLSLAMVTGNEEIYKLRALPMIEYVMSRERFLFSIEDKPNQSQNPSHFLKGPCVDIGELSGLHQFTKGQSTAFNEELNRLFGKTRKLNLDVETGGGSWQDYLARYHINNDKRDLETAVSGAENYLKKVFDNYSTRFKDFPAKEFTTDFTLKVYDLYQLYETTGIKRFLDASIVGARHIILWSRSNPQAPNTSITVNKGGEVEGIFPGRRFNNIQGESPFVKMDVVSYVTEHQVPAWQTSLVGLVPEAENTYMFGPVMLNHHAAWMLRLAKISGDTLLRDAAYNAIIGRYANFPGYYFTSFETNVYQKADYPMKPFFDVKYNAIFYNHVWPHLALLMDFLVSDFYYRSNGKIDFPSVYAPGYAFLTSKVYGNQAGTFMGNKGVRLWVPQGAISSSSIALNHIFGVTNKDLYVAFANTSPKIVKQTVRLNSLVIPWNSDKTYKVTIYNADGSIIGATTFKNGLLNVNVPANGLVAYKIEGLETQVALFQKQDYSSVKPSPTNRFKREVNSDSPLGITTAMIIQTFPQYANFYVFSDQTEKDWKSAILHYKIGDDSWKSIEDNSYPFEFDVHLSSPDASLIYRLEAIDIQNQKLVSNETIINN